MGTNASNGFGILIAFLIAVFLMCSAAGSWGADSRNMQLAAESLKWPVTRAKIVSSSLDVKVEHTKGGSYKTFKNLVQYEYRVNGKRYASDRICFAGVADHYSRDSLVTQHIGELYAVGTTHPVRYNPALPGESTLNAGVDADRCEFQSIKMFFFSLIVLAICAVSANTQTSSSFSAERIAGTFCFILGVLVMFIFGIFSQSTIVRFFVPQSAIVSFLR